jgi:hypothetical protein
MPPDGIQQMACQDDFHRKPPRGRRNQGIIAGNVPVDDIEPLPFEQSSQSKDGSHIQGIPEGKFDLRLHSSPMPPRDNDAVAALPQGFGQLQDVGFAASGLNGRTNLKDVHCGRRSPQEVRCG